MKIGIIGSSGFLGKNLKNFLIKRKKKVTLFSSFNSNKKNWITKVSDEIKRKKPEVIINCSAYQNLSYSHKNIKKLLKSNLYSNIFFLDQATKNKNFKAYISFGTKWELGNSKKEPLNFYAATKQANESFFKFFSNKRISIISLKIFDTYGKNDLRKKFLNDLLRCYKRNRVLNITHGKQYLDYVNIDDICTLIDLILNNLKQKKNIGFKTYTVSSKKPIKLLNLVNNLKKILDKKLMVNVGNIKYRSNESLKPIKDFSNYPGWKIQNNLMKDLKKIFDG